MNALLVCAVILSVVWGMLCLMVAVKVGEQNRWLLREIARLNGDPVVKATKDDVR